MMLIHAIVRKPCPSSKISSELNARFNNIEVKTIKQKLFDLKNIDFCL